MALEAAQMEEGLVGGSSSAAVVPDRVRREKPLAPLSGGSRSPARGEPLLQWMAAQDPTSALFSLDDHSESMERRVLTSEFRPCWRPWTRPEEPCVKSLFLLTRYSLDFLLSSHIFVFLHF